MTEPKKTRQEPSEEFDHDFDSANGEEDEAGRGGIWSDSLRKAVASGISAFMTTEEGIRQVLSDVRLPKERLAFIAQQADKTRREFYRALTDETKVFLEGVDLTGELRKALAGMKLVINAEVRFVEDGSTQSEVHTKIKREPSPPPDDDVLGSS